MKTDLLCLTAAVALLGGCTKGMTEIGEFEDTGSSTGQPTATETDDPSSTGEPTATDAPGDESASDSSGSNASTGPGVQCQAPGEGCDPDACQSYEEGVSLATLEGDVCTCTSAQRCLAWGEVEGIGGSSAPGCYFDPRTGEVAAHSTIWIELPEGWLHCGDPGSPPACACCADAMGCTPGAPMMR